MSIKLYADPITVNCRKVLAGFDFIGAPYELVFVDYFKGEQKSDWYTRLNPNASIPALADDEFVLWESNAMLQYAADKVGNRDAYPTDLKVRSDINRWLLWESSQWFPACYVYLVENCVKPVLGAQPDPAVLDANAAQFHKLAGILDARLAQSRWVAGDAPTIADIVLAAPMHLHGWQQLPLDAHPNIRRWMVDGVEQLPAWRKTTVYEGFTTTRPQ